jgi:hypothetical protein
MIGSGRKGLRPVDFYWPVPESEIVTGDERLVASVVICMVAVRNPVAVGENSTITPHCAPTSIVKGMVV